MGKGRYYHFYNKPVLGMPATKRNLPPARSAVEARKIRTWYKQVGIHLKVYVNQSPDSPETLEAGKLVWA